jgi:Protein of unknown function (DUF3631)
MRTCSFQHGENFMGVEKLSRDEIRRRIGLVKKKTPKEVVDKAIGKKRILGEDVDGSGIDGAALLDEVHKFLGRFVAYPSEHAHDAHVLWIAHAHLMEAWDSTPRLAFLSPEPKSGKTRALEVTAPMVPRAVEAVNVSPAYLFRKVGDPDGAPTILFDEIDTVFGPKAKENEEIRGLLNAGHRKGAVAGRCVVHGRQVMTEEIPAYSAVALAGLGWLPDTLLTRSVIIRMRRRKPGETVEPWRHRIHGKEAEAIGDLLAGWLRHILPAITGVYPEMPPGIEDRDADVWEALLSVADAAGGKWPVRAREAAKVLVGQAADVEPSLGIRLLADLKAIFDTSTLDAISTEVLIQRLTQIPEAPWGDLHGKPITDRTLAFRLRQYSVKSKDIRVADRSSPLKGYAREDLHDAWVRYLPPLSPPDARQARQARQTPENGGFSQESVADVANRERDNAPNKRDSDPGVADTKRDNPSERDRNNSTETMPVADVADVADLRGNGGGKPDPWEGLDIPDDLRREVPSDRRPALGLPGDSLDDFK